jgi:site-specific DNA-methyltransferase (cytosine-N4-specific)
MTVRILVGDALDMLRTLPSESVQVCVTSPPYFNQRHYGVDGQIGQDETADVFVARLVDVFREARRVLRCDGTLWLNIGDTYAGGGKGIPGPNARVRHAERQGFVGGGAAERRTVEVIRQHRGRDGTAKPKDLIGVPWLLAFALRADGWYLRSNIRWCKTAPIPESVTDRPTSAVEDIFLFSKSRHYYYDAGAVREGAHNLWNYWILGPEQLGLAHTAAFPTEIPRRCILAGSRPGDTVLDPFLGSGTTALVASRLGRDAIGIELNESYAELSRRRIDSDAPMVSEPAVVEQPSQLALLEPARKGA